MNSETGNSLWRLLHAYAASYPLEASVVSVEGAISFLEVFSDVVKDRSYGCYCHSEWLKIIQACPPVLSGKEEFLNWTIAAHDWINKKLNRKLFRPEISLSHHIFTTLSNG